MYCTVGITGRHQRFNIGLKQVRKSVQREMYEWIYHASENGISIEAVFLQMKVSDFHIDEWTEEKVRTAVGLFTCFFLYLRILLILASGKS
jgi:hypothetical protein